MIIVKALWGSIQVIPLIVIGLLVANLLDGHLGLHSSDHMWVVLLWALAFLGILAHLYADRQEERLSVARSEAHEIRMRTGCNPSELGIRNLWEELQQGRQRLDEACRKKK